MRADEKTVPQATWREGPGVTSRGAKRWEAELSLVPAIFQLRVSEREQGP